MSRPLGEKILKTDARSMPGDPGRRGPAQTIQPAALRDRVIEVEAQVALSRPAMIVG
jgi:hypothetical protein